MLKTVLDRFQRLNPLLFACMAGLIVIGVAFVYSACSVREDPELRMLYMRHAEVGVAGLAAYLLLAWVDYRTVIRRWGWLVYLARLAWGRGAGSSASSLRSPPSWRWSCCSLGSTAGATPSGAP